MAQHDSLISQLEGKYCPPLDSATFLAIISDYDVTNADEFALAQRTLEAVAESVAVEEASGFDPSGSSGIPAGASDGRSPVEDESEGALSANGWSSTTDESSLGHAMSALSVDGQDDVGGSGKSGFGRLQTELENLDEASKETLLAETFPGVKEFDIRWTLKKCKGDPSLAIEQLLNQVFLEENVGRFRGIEAFSESDVAARPKSGKGRKKKKLIKSEDFEDLPPQTPSAGPSKWENLSSDVDFVSSNAAMPKSQVRSIYHENGASLKATINAIIDAHAAMNLASEGDSYEAQARTISIDFPTIPLARLTTLVNLTPSLSSARALAKALTAPSPSTGRNTPIQLEFRLPPPDLSDGTSPSKPLSHNAVYGPDHDFSAGNSAVDMHDLIARRNNAFNQASAAHRKGKSDRLMGGAAAYYGQLGRDLSSQAKISGAIAADALVAQQSTPTQLDLHGVVVKDAVRIARERVTAWWVRATAPGTARGVTEYRIVTGRGAHSEGGRGKLGPAVAGMLLREGWRVEIGSGWLLVKGLAKKP